MYNIGEFIKEINTKLDFKISNSLSENMIII